MGCHFRRGRITRGEDARPVSTPVCRPNDQRQRQWKSKPELEPGTNSSKRGKPVCSHCLLGKVSSRSSSPFAAPRSLLFPPIPMAWPGQRWHGCRHGSAREHTQGRENSKIIVRRRPWAGRTWANIGPFRLRRGPTQIPIGRRLSVAWEVVQVAGFRVCVQVDVQRTLSAFGKPTCLFAPLWSGWDQALSPWLFAFRFSLSFGFPSWSLTVRETALHWLPTCIDSVPANLATYRFSNMTAVS